MFRPRSNMDTKKLDAIEEKRVTIKMNLNKLVKLERETRQLDMQAAIKDDLQKLESCPIDNTRFLASHVYYMRYTIMNMKNFRIAIFSNAREFGVMHT